MRDELLSFAKFFPTLCEKSWENVYPKPSMKTSIESEDDSMSDEDTTTSSKLGVTKCQTCISCVYKLLMKYRLYAKEYENLYLTHKLLLMLPMTQRSWECAFSRLKIIKNKLRSTVKEDTLEAYMLIICERETADGIEEDEIILKLSEKSSS